MKKSKHLRREKWYELVEAFDPNAYQRLPMKEGRSFILGNVRDLTIVEVSIDTPEEVVTKLGEYLKSQGIQALLVPPNIKFLKLREATPLEEEALNDAPREEEEKGAPDSGDADVRGSDAGDGDGSVADLDGSGDGAADEPDALRSGEGAADRE